MDNSYERLREERERLGLSQADFGELGGVKKQAQFNYEKGDRSPDIDYLKKIALAGADIKYIITGQRNEGQSVIPSLQNQNNDFVFVPRYDVHASAGNGNFVDAEAVVDRLAFRREWISSMGIATEALALIYVDGESMEPTLLHKDIILLNMSVKNISGDGIYVILYRDVLRVKRVQNKLAGGVVIKSDNPAYEPEILTYEDAQQLHIVGRVVWFGREI